MKVNFPFEIQMIQKSSDVCDVCVFAMGLENKFELLTSLVNYLDLKKILRLLGKQKYFQLRIFYTDLINFRHQADKPQHQRNQFLGAPNSSLGEQQPPSRI